MGQLEQGNIYQSGNGEFITEAISMNVASLRRWPGFGAVKNVVDQFTNDLVEGRVISCPHLRNPQPVIVAMAVPGRMYCRVCAGGELFSHLTDADGECDACGRSTATLFETTVKAGSVILFGNVCFDCTKQSLSEWAG